MVLVCQSFFHFESLFIDCRLNRTMAIYRPDVGNNNNNSNNNSNNNNNNNGAV